MATSKRMRHLILIALVISPIAALAQAQSAPAKKGTGAVETPGIVLLHGAFADGSSWQTVIPILQKAGYKVVAGQMPLVSFESDVAAAKRVIEGQAGELVVVGHSYAGAVVTEAAANNARIKALVFVAAFALDTGETPNILNGRYPKPPLSEALVKDAQGFVSIDPAKFQSVFAQDLHSSQTDILAAVQKPIFGGAFEAKAKGIAWKAIPSWYVLTTEDRALNPQLQRFMAQRMEARTTEIKSSHAVMLSKPAEVAKVILEAAKSEFPRRASK